eukprot:GHVT01013066.1.p1 GENE.GHVT01013066.1~~GHVT01013066.1.p1  ORF type:complete len:283 (-),score=36.26 GHVT01013066.1:568-1335(-)
MEHLDGANNTSNWSPPSQPPKFAAQSISLVGVLPPLYEVACHIRDTSLVKGFVVYQQDSSVLFFDSKKYFDSKEILVQDLMRELRYPNESNCNIEQKKLIQQIREHYKMKDSRAPPSVVEAEIFPKETENNSPLSPPLILVPVLATTIIGCGILGRLLVQRASKKSKAAKAEKKLKAKTAAVVPVKFSSKARVKHANVSSRLITRSSTMEWPIFYSSQQDMNSSGFQSEGWACTSAQEYSPTTEASVSSPDNYYG